MWNQTVVKDMLTIFKASVRAVQPELLIRKNIKLHNSTLEISDKVFDITNKRIFMVGFGKAVQNMAKEMERILGNRIEKGIISIPYKSTMKEVITGKVAYLEGGKNNLPDQKSLENTLAIEKLVTALTKDDLLIVLISGGGSALLVSPKPPLTIEAKQYMTKKLANLGADIIELNYVRKCMSTIKGGGLAVQAQPAIVVSLILSDLVDDKLDLIASGPTLPNEKDSSKAIGVLNKYKLFDTLPSYVKDVLHYHKTDIFPENVSNIVIGSNAICLNAAETEAKQLNYKPFVVSSSVTGSVHDVANIYLSIVEAVNESLKDNNMNPLNQKLKMHFQKDIKIRTEDIDLENGLCLIFGGETTVLVTNPDGVGGRNQQLALEFAALVAQLECPNLEIHLLCAGTDGIDGPTDAAGGISYHSLVRDAKKEGLIVEQFIAENNSYNFFKKFSNGQLHIKTGHTNTNVMDVYLLVIRSVKQ